MTEYSFNRIKAEIDNNRPLLTAPFTQDHARIIAGYAKDPNDLYQGVDYLIIYNVTSIPFLHGYKWVPFHEMSHQTIGDVWNML